MKKFFAANIDSRGRLIRGVLGMALVIAGVVVCSYQIIAAIALILSGGFCLFEAVRGWCVMRACGVKTRF
jgi:hypothetical protein